jgi:hypothetical protein
MALEPCPNCSKRISPQAEHCPRCGHPLSRAVWARARQKRKRRAAVFVSSVVVALVAGGVGLYIARSDAGDGLLSGLTGAGPAEATAEADSAGDRPGSGGPGALQQASMEATDAPTLAPDAGAAPDQAAGPGAAAETRETAQDDRSSGSGAEGAPGAAPPAAEPPNSDPAAAEAPDSAATDEASGRTAENADPDAPSEAPATEAAGPDRQPAGPQSASRTDATAQPEGAVPAPAARQDAIVRGIQRQLRLRGYDVGPIDGIYGNMTGTAIRAYQRDAGLEVTGEPSADLLRRLQ